MYVFLGLSYEGQIWFYRVASLVLPFVAYFVTRRVCLALQEAERVEADAAAARAKTSTDPPRRDCNAPDSGTGDVRWGT
jgi:hypothetical protein